jgi:C4-dicarboxylate-specific signal transduction histidine kinase
MKALVKRADQFEFWRSAGICVVGSVSMVLLAYGCFLLKFDLAAAGFSLLIFTAVLSLIGRFLSSIILSFVAVECLSYFFMPPIFNFRVDRTEDIVVLAAFLTTSMIITGLAARTRRLANEELLKTRAALARFSRVATLGELTASIAHEVNQPLASVVSSGNACLRWLAAEPPNIEKASHAANRIIRDANRASEVVQRVRGLVKNLPPQKSLLDINEAILEITVLSRQEIQQNQVLVRTELADDLPLVWADRIQLQQVVLNLVANAIEALKTVEEGPRFLWFSTQKSKPNEVVASVGDNGPGLDKEKLEDIFQAFYTTKSEGMGMGLAISRSIIETHGGRLWAAPRAPRGVTFQFTLPTVHV